MRRIDLRALLIAAMAGALDVPEMPPITAESVLGPQPPKPARRSAEKARLKAERKARKMARRRQRGRM